MALSETKHQGSSYTIILPFSLSLSKKSSVFKLKDLLALSFNEYHTVAR